MRVQVKLGDRINMRLTDSRSLLICFFVGLGVRFIPELLAFPLPIGFDTIYYAAVMKNGVIWSYWSTFFTSSWLLYALIVPIYSASRVDPFLLLKVLAPVLYGLNVAGIYWFARKMLVWDMRRSLLAGGFFVLQLAALRISWDLLRNVLGLGILLFALSFIPHLDSRRGSAVFVLLSLLTVFSHEYAAVTLLAIVSALMFWRLAKERLTTESKRLALAVSPALSVFLVGVILRVFPLQLTVETNVVNAGDFIHAHPGGLFFLVDYFSVKSALDFYATYWNLALSVLALFGLLYLSYLFLILKGFFGNHVLNAWTGLLLAGAFGCLVVPFCALEYWHRWMFMLVYPFAFYAVNGLCAFVRKFDGGNIRPLSIFSDRKTKAMVLLTASLGVAYLFTPVLMTCAGVSVSSAPATRVYFSTSPTVPYEDVNGVVKAMEWLDQNLDGGSCAVLQRAFLDWGRLYFDKSHVIVRFETDVNKAVNVALNQGFSRVFFVWWNTDIGWYGVKVPDYFVRLQDFGRISVYLYTA